MLIFPFVFYFTQLKNMNAKINAIKKAIEKDFNPLVDEFLNRQKNSGGRNAWNRRGRDCKKYFKRTNIK